MLKSKLTRRRLLATAAASVIAMPYVRGAHAAGKLSVGFWDHWVPGANTASQKLCEEWAAKEKVDLAIDYITSQGNKNLLTIAAEAQARSGHDIFQFPSWQPADHANRLEPVDDVMTELIKQNGAVNPTVEYLAKSTGRWVAVPAAVGSQIKGPCSRIDLMKKYAGIDVQAMYPAGSPAKADAWTLDAMLMAAEACYKGGYPFGIGLGVTEDNVDTAGAIFQSFGANLVDATGNVAVKTDAVRQALEYYKKLAQWLPPDAPAWDNASNNKYLIAGKGSLIMNPRAHGRSPSAMRRRSPSNCGRTACPPARKDATRRSCLTSTASGNSARTNRRPRACSSICRNQRRSRRWSTRASGTTCRRSKSSRRSRFGRRKGRPKVRSTTIPIRTITRFCRSRPNPPRRRSRCRSIARRSKPRWWCASCRARRSRRRSLGRRPRSKASCGPEGARGAALRRLVGWQHRRARQRAPSPGEGARCRLSDLSTISADLG